MIYVCDHCSEAGLAEAPGDVEMCVHCWTWYHTDEAGQRWVLSASAAARLAREPVPLEELTEAHERFAENMEIYR